ncbi:hypothetical protein BDEG_26360 [Batrachochytrium dendrobatidis JEL423]|uniref:Uncharacterized protein n=1 Tax=Batrachochytrium dendrobatidis (strain JEL423) TaxID=403673 RepID=A0A177WTI7_BATDL|nr:hypothetical protein BDEG_26360 [Batrachochytrium dendrobatidis JEL423]
MSLLSATVSAVVIDRSSTSELTAVVREKMVEESLARARKRRFKHTGICASTGTEQQSTGTSHDVAQSTANPDDSGNSAEQSNERTVEGCLARIKQRICRHIGVCFSTKTKQSTGTNHDVAQLTVDPNDLDNSAEQSNESPSSFESDQSKPSNEPPSSSQSDQKHDGESDNRLYSNIESLPKSYVPENQRTFITTQRKLDILERKMKELGMRIPTKIGNGYPHGMSDKYVKILLDYDWEGLEVPKSEEKNQLKAILGSEWEFNMLKLEPIEEASIRVVSEPTPQLKSILKSGPTSKSHGSKHGHSRKHQQKSNHDTGSRKAKVHFGTLTRKVFKKKLFEGKYKTTITDISQNEESVGETNPGYATDKNDQTKNNRGAAKSRSNKSKTDDENGIQPTQSTSDDDGIQPTQSTRDDDEIQPTQSTSNEEEIQPTQPTQPTQSTSNEEESQPTQSTRDDDESQPTQPTQPTQSTSNKSKGRSVLSILKDMFKFKIVKPELPKLKLTFMIWYTVACIT